MSLVKPHYEVVDDEKRWLVSGALPHDRAPLVLERVLAEMPGLGVRSEAWTTSPIQGGKSRRRRGAGNLEYLALLVPDSAGGTDEPTSAEVRCDGRKDRV